MDVSDGLVREEAVLHLRHPDLVLDVGFRLQVVEVGQVEADVDALRVVHFYFSPYRALHDPLFRRPDVTPARPGPQWQSGNQGVGATGVPRITQPPRPLPPLLL